MINDIKSSSFSASTAISSGQQAVDSGIQKAAISPVGIATARDSFEIAAKQSAFETNPTTMAQPASVDEPVGYLNRASEYGKAISAHAQNQDLLRLMSDPNLDLTAGVNELNEGVKNVLKEALKPGEGQRKDLQEEIKKKQEEMKRLQAELEEASDKSGAWDVFKNFFGDDGGQAEQTGSIFVELSRYTAIKKDDDD